MDIDNINVMFSSADKKCFVMHETGTQIIINWEYVIQKWNYWQKN